MMMIQNAIAKLPSELKELKNMFQFSAFHSSNSLLWYFQNHQLKEKVKMEYETLVSLIPLRI